MRARKTVLISLALAAVMAAGCAVTAIAAGPDEVSSASDGTAAPSAGKESDGSEKNDQSKKFVESGITDNSTTENSSHPCCKPGRKPGCKPGKESAGSPDGSSVTDGSAEDSGITSDGSTSQVRPRVRKHCHSESGDADGQTDAAQSGKPGKNEASDGSSADDRSTSDGGSTSDVSTSQVRPRVRKHRHSESGDADGQTDAAQSAGTNSAVAL